ncbi:MAG: septal ring lytic transglycosylase RlpA family protein [Myxococcales bacterium]|nr:septal ring lytic transglycosylase RlpA family protein [Myxococcales bacterium]
MRWILLLLAGCAGRVDQLGRASWTGDSLAGKTTASGEKFDPEDMTASHRTLPFDTKVRVHNLKSGRKVKVWINDRGPSVKGRVIGVSRRAAERLRMIEDGVVPVELKVKRCGSRNRRACELARPERRTVRQARRKARGRDR